ICVVILLMIPSPVFARELPDEQINVRILTPAEAERLYFDLTFDETIQPYSDLGVCDICISESNGELIVVYSTTCRGIADKIGVRNMTLQQKKGLKWKEIVLRSEYSENTDAYFGGFILEAPEIGGKYRVKGTHYIIKDSVETSRYAETDTYVMPDK
ncbi:MAG: hypothetical protein K2L86_06075, partial [Lachnospiraceae bacterium]|nr:hypothetical protein [Lachnospiraceae bacterium]